MPERTTTRQAETIIGITKGEITTTINTTALTTKITASITTKGFLTSIRISSNRPDTTKTRDMNLIINTISSNINSMRKGKPEII